MYKTDKKLMEMEGERKKDNAYKAYVLDRFTVEDVHEGPKGLCATIHDKETDEPKHYHKGDNLADGKIQMVDSDGIVFWWLKDNTIRINHLNFTISKTAALCSSLKTRADAY